MTEGYHRKANVFTPTSIVQVASELGMEHVVLISFSRSGIHHGNDENARYLTQVTNDAMAKLVSVQTSNSDFTVFCLCQTRERCLETDGIRAGYSTPMVSHLHRIRTASTLVIPPTRNFILR